MSDKVSGSLEEWHRQVESARSEVADDLFPELTSPIKEILRCEVQYVLDPRALPLKNLDFESLDKALRAEYGFTFVPEPLPIPDLTDQHLGINDLGQLRLKMEEPSVQFSNGLLRIPEARAIAIPTLSIDTESVHCSVAGVTLAGETIIQEIVPLLWAILGVTRTWGEDLQKSHQIVRYGTSTLIRLPEQALPLLSGPFLTLLDSWTSDSDGPGARMGARSVLADWEQAEANIVRYTLDELEILFHRLSGTGYTETSSLRLSVRARHQRGTGVLAAISELPYPEHVRLVEDIVDALSK